MFRSRGIQEQVRATVRAKEIDRARGKRKSTLHRPVLASARLRVSGRTELSKVKLVDERRGGGEGGGEEGGEFDLSSRVIYRGRRRRARPPRSFPSQIVRRDVNSAERAQRRRGI